ncbi:SURF1 family cytochrome oxidase biogenesis protein [Demequina sp.]|uniref:SURF1 family protein n=1 Tax=Demequina sp. TaxID=2050685 RepID=UPI0025BF1387|nr:SURF1 family cytochrome oxidase biogenesis protein [Demequina sp.]
MLTVPSGPSSPPRSAATPGWLAIGTAALLGVSALAVGALLGTWQWDRAHQQASAIEADPPAPLADVMRPAESGRGEGRLVEVEGMWVEADVALVAGKEIDGADAVLLVMPLEVPATATGTGSAATLPVLRGWRPANDVTDVPRSGVSAAVSGYVRGGEGSAPTPDRQPIDGAVWVGSMATGVLAQEWPSPMYTYLVVSDTPAPGWNAMPPPPDRSRLDVRSLTYAAEWWIFGVFGALLAARYIRDNVQASHTKEES